MNARILVPLLLLGLAAPGFAHAGDPLLPPGLHFFTGDLHAHSSYSDGVGSPAEVFAASRANGLDFFALTEHSEAFDIPLSANEGCLSDPAPCLTSPTVDKWAAISRAAEAATEPGAFVAFRGFEVTLDAQGHLNVFGSAGYFERAEAAEVAMAPFWSWFTREGENVVLADGRSTSGLDGLLQFNHPGTDKNRLPDADSLRWDDFAYVPEADARAVTIEVFNSGPGTIHQEWYGVALDAGWHVAPTAVSDTHDNDAGMASYGRTLVVAPALTAGDLRAALLARHVAATIDADLRIVLRSGDGLMGDRLVGAAGSTVPLTVRVADASVPVTRIDLVTNGGAVLASGAPDSLGALHASLTVPAEGETYVFARAWAGGRAVAFTAPLWVRATGS